MLYFQKEVLITMNISLTKFNNIVYPNLYLFPLHCQQFSKIDYIFFWEASIFPVLKYTIVKKLLLLQNFSLLCPTYFFSY